MNTKHILFYINCVRHEAQLGGEVIKALENFERIVKEEPEPLAVVEGWMTTVHFCGNKRLRPGENLSGLVSGDKGKTRRRVIVTITKGGVK